MGFMSSGLRYLQTNCDYMNWGQYFKSFEKICSYRQDAFNKKIKGREGNEDLSEDTLIKDWMVLCVVEINNPPKPGKMNLMLQVVDFSSATVITDKAYEYRVLIEPKDEKFYMHYRPGDLISGFEAYKDGYYNIQYLKPIECKNIRHDNHQIRLNIDMLKRCYENTLKPGEVNYPTLLEIRDEYVSYKLKIEELKRHDKETELEEIQSKCEQIQEQITKQKQTITELDKEYQALGDDINAVEDKLVEAKKTRENKEKEWEQEKTSYDKAVKLLADTRDKLAKSIEQRDELEKRIGDVKKNEQEMIDISHRRYQAEKELLTLDVKIKDKKNHQLLQRVERLREYGLGFLQEEDMATKSSKIKNWDGNSKQELMSTIKAYVESNGFYYGQRVVESFVEAMYTNQLIILYGPTGTGKTSLPQLVAGAVGGSCQIISVQSNWNDDQDLLGFYNVVQKKYIPTKFLDTLVEARNNKDKLYFIVLDEMNLAQVEYYFAKILSAMEIEDKSIDLFSQKDSENSRDRILFKVENLFKKYMNEDKKKRISDASKLSELEKLNFIREVLAEEAYNDQEIDVYFKLLEEWNNLNNYPSQITIPENVQFVGTINMDASTKNISPKVVDRSFLIELREEKRVASQANEAEEARPCLVSMKDIRRIIDANGEYYGDNKDKVISIVNEFINNFNKTSGLELRLSMRGYERIADMIKGMSELSMKEKSNASELDLLDGDMDDNGTKDNQGAIYMANDVAADIIKGKVLASMSDGEISENIKDECIGIAPQEVKDKLERMYDDDFARFNYWR